jgi:hypothetical protein
MRRLAPAPENPESLVREQEILSLDAMGLLRAFTLHNPRF